MSDRTDVEDPFGLGPRISEAIASFTEREHCQISRNAHAIIRHALFSVATDDLGMGDISINDRYHLSQELIRTLPIYLHLLRTSPTDKRGAKLNANSGPEFTVIGGIMVAQTLGDWTLLSGCTCWPR
jgi:hypothetical protein